MSEESPEEDQPVMNFIEWLLTGNALFVTLKFLWIGMITASLLLFRLKLAAGIAIAGVIIWFLWNDRHNWHIEME